MSNGLAQFEQLWQRMHSRDDELRPRLVAWLRDLIPTLGPDAHQVVSAYTLNRGDGWQYIVSWQWEPGGRRRRQVSPQHAFPLAPLVPEELTADDVRTLGLPDRLLFYAATTWMLEVFGQAWVEAGLAARPIQLVLDNAGFRGPGQPFAWLERLRAYAYRATAPLPPSIRELPPGDRIELVAPPNPLSLPETPAALRDACLAGEPGAVLAWADALGAAGDAASAGLLRWLHGFPDAIRGEVQRWLGDRPFWVYAYAAKCWWGCGESGTEPDDIGETGTRLGQLLAGWNVYYPAAEWLIRRLGLARVEVGGSYFADGSKVETFKVNLTDQHLAPVGDTMGVTQLRAEVARRPRRSAKREG